MTCVRYTTLLGDTGIVGANSVSYVNTNDRFILYCPMIEATSHRKTKSGMNIPGIMVPLESVG